LLNIESRQRNRVFAILPLVRKPCELKGLNLTIQEV